MLQDSFDAAQVDMQERALREEQVEAERLLLATQAALDADGDLLDASERTNVETRMQSLREIALGLDHQAIKQAIQSLSDATEDLAARRMDRSVRLALRGKALDQL